MKIKDRDAINDKITQLIEEKRLYIPSGIYQMIGGYQKASGHVRIPHFKEVARLNSGQAFGELALMASQPRSASA